MPRSASTLIRDAAVVAAAGIVVALVANAISPRGLSLRRDYFAAVPPSANAEAVLRERGRGPSPRLETPGMPPPPASAPANTTKRGLPLVTYDEIVRRFHDPKFAAGRIIFVDARSEARYETGHIPGAYSFDHYRPEEGAASVLAAAQVADQIVVYCQGGGCEDSELAALDLIALGVPAAKLVVYGGGITEWQQRGMAVTTGAKSP